jgi:phosphohistidine phosphatase SixA
MLRLLVLAASFIALSPVAFAEDVAAALAQGGYVIVFRHGATTNGMADPMGAGRGKSTATERQLSPRGRQTALEIGGALKTLHIPIGAVYTSQLQRAVDTGRLISGKEVTTTADLSEAGEHVTPAEKDHRAEEMLKIASTRPAKGTNTVVVSHKPNIVDAFGNDWSDVREGEASIFKPDGSGKYALVGRVQAGEWLELAKHR